MGGVHGLDQAVRQYFTGSIAQSTAKSYQSAANRYLSFCAQFQLPPLQQNTIARFVAFLAQSGVGYSSIRMYLCGIRFLQVSYGLPDPNISSFPHLMCLALYNGQNAAIEGEGCLFTRVETDLCITGTAACFVGALIVTMSIAASACGLAASGCSVLGLTSSIVCSNDKYVCTELFRQGLLSSELLLADMSLICPTLQRGLSTYSSGIQHHWSCISFMDEYL